MSRMKEDSFAGRAFLTVLHWRQRFKLVNDEQPQAQQPSSVDSFSAIITGGLLYRGVELAVTIG